jgi:tRNA A-37 threonylcarbamoyl transferase component Bud32/tetratricopeptide (TPR) repeat protein
VSAPLHERVARALDAAGDRVGAELLGHIEREHADDPELVAECRALFSMSTGTSDTLPGLDTHASNAAREALEHMHDRLVRRGTLTPTLDTGGGIETMPRAIPAMLGPYRIIRQLGEGGMGIVYEAEQPSPKRRVAIKVIRSAHSGRTARARFRHEAQVLANLKHPGIAQIIEASADDTTNDAYFVMEYVEGVPLTTYAERHGLSLNARVELAAQVCDAVQHAHQKGVIHRDLKPANILVERTDTASPQPKVLDFGVAKLTRAEATSGTLAVDANRIVGTLAYMSPEALGSGSQGAESVDTRTDVYALGVILYELLAGRLPIDVKADSLTQAAARIQHEMPPPLARLSPSLRGDLDVIASTALAKDRERRYASAAELAADLRRYLRHEPISARPPGTLYTLGKFVRRRRALAAAVAACVLALVSGAVVSTVQYLRAERARAKQVELTALAEQRLVEQVEATKRADAATKRAEAVKTYFATDLIVAATPERLGPDAKITDVLDAAYAAVPDRFADQPGLKSELFLEFSGAYNLLGRFDAAVGAVKNSIESRRATDGPDAESTIESEVQLCVVLNSAQRFDEAEPILRELVPRVERLLPPENPVRLRLAAAWGNLLQIKGETDEAIRVLSAAAKAAETALPITDTIRASVRGNLAATLMRAGKVPEAVEALGTLLGEQEASLSPTDPAVLSTINNYIVGLINLKRYPEAVSKATDLVQRVDRSHPPNHPSRGYSRATLAAALQRSKRWDEARAPAREAFGVFKESLGEAAWDTEQLARRVVDIELKSGHPDAARTWALEAQKIRCFASGEGEGATLRQSFLDEGKRLSAGQSGGGAEKTPIAEGAAADTARSLLQELIGAAETTTPPSHPRRAKYLVNLARASLLLDPGRASADLAAGLLGHAREAVGSSQDKDVAGLIETVEREWKASP